jgi:hypothetical protein
LQVLGKVHARLGQALLGEEDASGASSLRAPGLPITLPPSAKVNPTPSIGEVAGERDGGETRGTAKGIEGETVVRNVVTKYSK